MINQLDLKSGISSFTISLGNASCGLILIEFTAVAKDSIDIYIQPEVDSW